MGKRNSNKNNVTDINKMRNKKTRPFKRIKLPVVIISIILIYIAFIFIRQEIIIKDLTKKEQISKKELKELKEEIEDLKQKINKSDTVEYIEKIAREELDMIKPHEIIYKDKNKQKRD